MRQATIDDHGQVMALLDARTTWLQSQGTDQWSTRAFSPVMADAIERGETWLLYDDDQAIATLTLTTIADPDFWSPEERLVPAYYLSKLATRLDRRGEGLGALLIDWATGYASERGVLWLRWDVWRNNAKLQQYYRDLGAHQIRTVEKPGRHSGVLFQLSRAPRPLDVTTATEFGPIATLPSHPFVIIRGDEFDALSTGNSTAREHCLIINDWMLTDAIPAQVTEQHRPVLFDAGDGWHIRSHFAYALDPWPPTLDATLLHRGHTYRLQLGDEDPNTVVLFGNRPSGTLPA